ncbi:MAG TPA: zf-HC2 domain-containing protein [Terriglobales bacterium]|nr:zf-HC2 domain-containing protein [Terriglobales bacterium]
MAGQGHNGIQCSEFDALLSQAIDGTLSGERLQAFEAHGRECQLCGPMLRDAEAGRSWLKSLEEIEPPAHLVNNILLATSGVAAGKATARATWGQRIGGWVDAILAPLVAVARQPRFAMSFGMAFFTLSVTLSIAGVRLSDIRHISLRPSTVRRTYYETQGRVVKYYENIRFVYEIESRVRQLKQAAPSEDRRPTQPANNNENKKKNSSGQPEKQERNYSQEGTHVMYAALPAAGDLQPADLMRTGMVDSPVVHGATYRRFV